MWLQEKKKNFDSFVCLLIYLYMKFPLGFLKSVHHHLHEQSEVQVFTLDTTALSFDKLVFIFKGNNWSLELNIKALAGTVFFLFSLQQDAWLPLLLLLCSCWSAAQLCPTLCDPVDCSRLGFPVFHPLPQFAQTHVQRPLSRWCHLTVSSPVTLFSCPQSFPAPKTLKSISQPCLLSGAQVLCY